MKTTVKYLVAALVGITFLFTPAVAFGRGLPPQVHVTPKYTCTYGGLHTMIVKTVANQGYTAKVDQGSGKLTITYNARNHFSLNKVKHGTVYFKGKQEVITLRLIRGGCNQ